MENISFFKQIPIILRYKAVSKKYLLFIPFVLFQSNAYSFKNFLIYIKANRWE